MIRQTLIVGTVLAALTVSAALSPGAGFRRHASAAPDTVYAGRHNGAYESDRSLSIHTSANGAVVTQIDLSDIICGPHSHRFSVTLNPGLPITDNRFSASDIPVSLSPPSGHPHSLDIDGILFDADGDGTLEQALGGLAFVSELSRCSAQWWASAVASDTDNDGWSDTAERRLGSNPSHLFSKPEHREVPTTLLYGTDVCHDFSDNDSDQLVDQDDPDCSELKNVYAPLVRDR